jgi:hypothetical protein
MGVNDPNQMASSRLSAAPLMAPMGKNTTTSTLKAYSHKTFKDPKTVANPANFPAILLLSEEEKAVVQDKITQIIPLHAKLDVLMRTLAQLGGTAEMDKLRRLASIVNLFIL